MVVVVIVIVSTLVHVFFPLNLCGVVCDAPPCTCVYMYICMRAFVHIASFAARDIVCCLLVCAYACQHNIKMRKYVVSAVDIHSFAPHGRVYLDGGVVLCLQISRPTLLYVNTPL